MWSNLKAGQNWLQILMHITKSRIRDSISIIKEEEKIKVEKGKKMNAP